MAALTTLFHDEITDNFDVASCTQKIASWDTIRSSSDVDVKLLRFCLHSGTTMTKVCPGKK